MISILTGILFGLCIRAGLETIGKRIASALESFAEKINIHVPVNNQIKPTFNFEVAENFAERIKEVVNQTAYNELQKMAKEATQELVRIQRAKAERARRMQKAQAEGRKYTPRKKISDPVEKKK